MNELRIKLRKSEGKLGKIKANEVKMNNDD